MKRWPTEPVAPSTPAIGSVDYHFAASKYTPHFFLGKFRLCDVKCSASMFVVAVLEFLSQLGILSFMTRMWGENATPIAEVQRWLTISNLEHLRRPDTSQLQSLMSDTTPMKLCDAVNDAKSIDAPSQCMFELQTPAQCKLVGR